MKIPLIQVSGLTKKYIQTLAVNQLTFEIYPGETLGLVGESGCGKSTTGRMLVQLENPTDGEIVFNGQQLTNRSFKERKKFKKELQIIFQDPYSSLNPRMTLGEILKEPLSIHNLVKRGEEKGKIAKLLNLVNLDESFASRYPHEISGGQRQRIGIARALAVGPKFIVCDEPISALDVSIQAQIVNLLKKLQQEMGLTYLFISHDLSMVKYISHRIAVMYLGHLVELAPADALYRTPLHPYTETLLSAIFLPDPVKEKARPPLPLAQEPSLNAASPVGCSFAHRCPKVKPLCHIERPRLKELAPGHHAACHLY